MSGDYLNGTFGITRVCGHKEDSCYSGKRDKKSIDSFVKKESEKKCFKCIQSETYDLTAERC